MTNLNDRSPVRALPRTRREASGVCDLCGCRVLAFEVGGGAGWLLVDPSTYQKQVADLVVDATAGPAARRALPPWNWGPSYALPHECPPVGEGPADDPEEIRRALDGPDGAGVIP